ncbi:stage II sporulation protein P [Dethiothermospora halolimnae]|uniref:stage II sporulation protein P n=1 Tax=Dethiothermospora halolimnae TaxID=3114390 RepID=UPI003CCBE8A0
MQKGRRHDKGIVYIFIAVICLIVFFIGFNVINRRGIENKKYTQIRLSLENKEDNLNQSVTAFSKSEEEKKELDINKVKIKDDDKFFFRILSDSNIYLKLAYEKRYGEDSHSILGTSIKEIINKINPKSYLKSQFPAIINLLDKGEGDQESVKVLSQNKSSKKTKGEERKVEEDDAIILEDIIFVEDPEEGEKGEILETGDDPKEDDTIKGIVVSKPTDIQAISYNRSKPYILMYHTHGTEAYLPYKANQYHTKDRRYNVTTVGEVLSKNLISKGHNVKHVETFHDIPSYNKSYIRSLSTAKEVLKQEKNLKVVFDVHRDGVADNASYLNKAKNESKININGKSVATFSLVVGPDSKNKQQVLNFNKYIKRVSDKLYPGLCKGIIIKPSGRYNQFLSDYYALIEVGSNLNTVDEAKECAKVLSEIIDQVIKGISI